MWKIFAIREILPSFAVPIYSVVHQSPGLYDIVKSQLPSFLSPTCDAVGTFQPSGYEFIVGDHELSFVVQWQSAALQTLTTFFRFPQVGEIVQHCQNNYKSTPA